MQTSVQVCLLSFIFMIALGENAIVIVGGANQKLQPGEVRGARDLVARAKVVICQLEIQPETTLSALKMAKELGGKLACVRVHESA